MKADMRRLLTLLMAIALVMLPMGGMAARAHAAARAGDLPCHHQAVDVGHAVRSQHQAHTHAGHAHTSRAVAAGSHADHHHHTAAPVEHADVSRAAVPPCPHCGPDCHCLTACATACGTPVNAEATGLLRLDAAAGKVSPADETAPPAWQTRPWPPPPRA